MSKREKLLKRLLSKPSDFEWRELEAVMEIFGFELKRAGGSGRKFVRPEAIFAIHERHPHSVLKAYQVSAVIAFLRKEGHFE